MRKSKTAVVFGGQNTQYVGMGSDLKIEGIRQRVFEIANRVLGFDLWEICQHGPIELLSRTDIAQPAIFAVNHCKWLEYLVNCELDPERFPRPAALLGHSLGEYNAIVAAKVVPFDPVIAFVRDRGALMLRQSKDYPGKMVAVLSRSDINMNQIKMVREQCRVYLANDNGPTQIVLSGEIANIDLAAAELKSMGYRIWPLDVSGAFHCRLMAGAGKELAKKLRDWELSEFQIPVVLNVTTKYASLRGLRKYPTKQLVSTILFRQCVLRLISAGIRDFRELSPKPILTKMIERTMASVAHSASAGEFSASFFPAT